MRAVVVALGLIACIATSALAAGTVVDATDATFEEVIKSSDLVMMEFYAPWCGHCKKLEPEYNEAAKQLGDKATLAKIDATVEKANAGKYGIQGFPTIKIFRDGALAGDYEGGRTAADMVQYVKANTGPAVNALASAADLESFKNDNKVAAVLFAETAGGDKYEALETAAKAFRAQFSFGLVTDAGLAEADGAAFGDLVVFKQFDDKKVKYAGEFNAEAIKTFLGAEGVPLFDEIGPQNYKSYLERKLPIVWIFATKADEAVLAAGQAAAPGFKGQLSWVWIDSSKYAGMAQRLGLSGNKFPAVAIDNEGKHFAMPDGEYTEATLTAFATQYVKGELKQTIRSEDEPAEHTIDGLTTIVGSNFDSLVTNSDVDVFIEFYAPWCGHCKNLAPTYAEVAKKFADKPVRIAKIDATANDFDQELFAVKGFPTMFFVPKSTHQPQLYEGGRSEDDLTSFLEKQMA